MYSFLYDYNQSLADRLITSDGFNEFISNYVRARRSFTYAPEFKAVYGPFSYAKREQLTGLMAHLPEINTLLPYNGLGTSLSGKELSSIGETHLKVAHEILKDYMLTK